MRTLVDFVDGSRCKPESFACKLGSGISSRLIDFLNLNFLKLSSFLLKSFLLALLQCY